MIDCFLYFLISIHDIKFHIGPTKTTPKKPKSQRKTQTNKKRIVVRTSKLSVGNKHNVLQLRTKPNPSSLHSITIFIFISISFLSSCLHLARVTGIPKLFLDIQLFQVGKRLKRWFPATSVTWTTRSNWRVAPARRSHTVPRSARSRTGRGTNLPVLLLSLENLLAWEGDSLLHERSRRESWSW